MEVTANTYERLYREARARVEPMEAKFLLMTAADKSHEELIRDYPLIAPKQVAAKFADMLSRRLDGQPLAYIIGSWSFLGLTLTVTPDVLIPRMDTEVLAEAAIKLAPARSLDLCCGSGCVALAIASNVERARVVMLDFSDAALRIARKNARDLKLQSRVTAVRGDALSPPPADMGQFDALTCNPPYIPTHECDKLDSGVRDYEPRMALDGGADGLRFYRAVLAHWSDCVKRGGKMLFEVGIGQSAAVESLMLLTGYRDIEIVKDTANIERVVIGTKGR
ncbi:release factor glutamine methyltransferase [Clostridia bacterium]|nr:release factor glutamine methyltransferase [Clostridia bacterium]